MKISRKRLAIGLGGLLVLGIVLIGLASSHKNTALTSSSKSKTIKPLDAWQTNDHWAGYLKRGHNITAVSGQWTVPKLLYSNDIRGSGSWIGIGGWDSLKLLQVGIVHFETVGITQPYVFTQRYPLEPRNIEVPNVSVKTGDQVSASIKKLSGNSWRLSLKNLTNGQQFSKTVNYQPDQNSAEWIFEWVTPEKYKLPAFDSFSFSHLTFSGDAPALVSTDRLKMIKGKRLLVEPSKLSASGNSFSLTYKSR